MKKTSSSEIAISVSSVSKSYFKNPLRLSERPSVLDVIKNGFKSDQNSQSKFKVLDNVSFDVPKGTSLGIIGNNGAGKSTLMQILAGITKPDQGEVQIKGRVASILSVGTGFHPELSGRENVFMSGQLLGMSKKEIDQTYDEIVAFSELEDKMEQQVKYYSNGMYLRLAFSVFSHLRSDIVLLDEVYSVGDAFFRKKCELAIDRMLAEGRTVIIVSHSISDLKDNVNKMLLMADGKVLCHDKNEVVLEKYFLDHANNDLSKNLLAESGNFNYQMGSDNDEFCIGGVKVFGAKTGFVNTAERDEDLSVEVILEKKQTVRDLTLIVVVHAIDGGRVMMDSTMFRDTPELMVKDIGAYRIVCNIPGGMLYKGSYFLNVRVTDEDANILFETGVQHLFRVLPAKWEEQDQLTQLNISVQPQFEWKLERD
ncbi:MAG: ATP-binding cassette domain-containing protein [Flavobacteriales bacterium]|nr:ATP-binding cassette domain-containing protein [Flavobacteriales bacterium]